MMGIKKRGSKKYATLSKSDDSQRRQLAKHPFYGESFRNAHRRKPNIRSKAIANHSKWISLGMIEDDSDE